MFTGKCSSVITSQLQSSNLAYRSELKTRVIKMTSLEGEYRLLGRMNVDSSNVFVQYGQGETRTVNITQGPGRQEAEFVDGLRFSIESQTPVRMNVDLKFPVEQGAVPAGMNSLCKLASKVRMKLCISLTDLRLVCVGGEQHRQSSGHARLHKPDIFSIRCRQPSISSGTRTYRCNSYERGYCVSRLFNIAR